MKIGVTKVKTHSRVREGKVATLIQRGKELIEIFRAGEHGVFQGEPQPGLSGQQQSRPQRIHEPCSTLAEVQVQVQQFGANFRRKLDRAIKTTVLAVAQRIDFQRGVNREFDSFG